jgi:hypothetical protein
MTETTAASTRVPVSIQLIGGPTVLLEIGGLRPLTDPALDAPVPVPSGDRTLTRTTGPAAAAEEIGPIDAALLSHDQHGGNPPGLRCCGPGRCTGRRWSSWSSRSH